MACCSFLCFAMLPENQRGSPSGLYPQSSQQLSDSTLTPPATAAEFGCAGPGEVGVVAAVVHSVFAAVVVRESSGVSRTTLSNSYGEERP